MALCIPVVGKSIMSYDYAKAAISLEYSNSFLWPKDNQLCPNSSDPFPSSRVGSRDETRTAMCTSVQCRFNKNIHVCHYLHHLRKGDISLALLETGAIPSATVKVQACTQQDINDT